MITRFWILWKLRKFAAALKVINLQDENLTDLVSWRRNFEAFLSQIYPNGSDLQEASQRILKYAGQQYERAVYPSAALTGPTEDYEKAVDPTHPLTRLDYKSKYCQEYQTILDDLRFTVKNQGVPPGYKPPAWHPYLVAITAALVTAALAIPSTCYLAKRDSDEKAQDLQRQAVVGVSDFYRLLADYDTHFKTRALDSVVNSFVQRGTFESGVYIGGMINFAEGYRRMRDNSIDSALVRLGHLGVNCDTLRFTRRLPIRIGQALKGRAQKLGLDIGAINTVLQSDTL